MAQRWKHRTTIIVRILSKTFYKLLGRWNARLQPNGYFSIKRGYHHASSAESFDPTGSTDEFQKSVYALAASFADRFSIASVLDVGCGSGYKLIHMLGKHHTTGIEVEPVYQWLLEKYPGRDWLMYQPGSMPSLKADVVICSDVIEHIENPDDLMEFLTDIEFRYLIISTPERDRISGKNDFGPPENTSHYREWNSAEFRHYVRNFFEILEHHVFDDKSVCQVVVCTRRIEVES